MLEWHDYDIRIWKNGDVSISSRELLEFAQMSGMSGLQVNDKSKLEDIRKASIDVANAMRALDALVGDEA